MIKFPVSLVAAIPMLLALSACEVTTCKKGDECFDDDFFNDDAGENNGGGNDGDGGDGDGSTTGGKVDGGSGGKADAGTSGPVMTIEEFCAAQLSVGTAWAKRISYCCEDVSQKAEALTFLNNVLLYPDAALDKCVRVREAAIDSGKVKFETSKALECATAFAAAYMPPAGGEKECGGFDLIALEGAIGHGAPQLKQIPVCRQALAGTVLSSKPCTEQLECSGNLRCRPFSGSGATNKACQSAVGSGGGCIGNSDCDDGLTCVGNDQAGGRQCLPKNDLSFAGNCSASSECSEGRICNDSGLCAPATGGTLVCKMP